MFIPREITGGYLHELKILVFSAHSFKLDYGVVGAAEIRSRPREGSVADFEASCSFLSSVFR